MFSTVAKSFFFSHYQIAWINKHKKKRKNKCFGAQCNGKMDIKIILGQKPNNS